MRSSWRRTHFQNVKYGAAIPFRCDLRDLLYSHRGQACLPSLYVINADCARIQHRCLEMFAGLSFSKYKRREVSSDDPDVTKRRPAIRRRGDTVGSGFRPEGLRPQLVS